MFLGAFGVCARWARATSTAVGDKSMPRVSMPCCAMKAASQPYSELCRSVVWQIQVGTLHERKLTRPQPATRALPSLRESSGTPTSAQRSSRSSLSAGCTSPASQGVIFCCHACSHPARVAHGVSVPCPASGTGFRSTGRNEALPRGGGGGKRLGSHLRSETAHSRDRSRGVHACGTPRAAVRRWP